MKINYLIMLFAICMSQAHSFSLPKKNTKSYECDVCSTLSHETLQDKWHISGKSLNTHITNRQKSFGYQQKVTLKQLEHGVIISTRAPGAVIRITPLQDKPLPSLILSTPTNTNLTIREASALYSQDEPFDESLLASQNQTMLQIKPELGAGKFTLKSVNSGSLPSDAFMISVFDKFSLVYLQIESDSIHYQYGDKLTAWLTLKDNAVNYSVDDLDVFLKGPQGEVIPLKAKEIKANKFEVTGFLTSETNNHGENWYIEATVFSESDQEIIQRTARTAFSYSIPSARLSSIKKLSSKPLTFVATLQVATGSRYALQSVLYHKNSLGKIEPIETSQKAQWLDPGTKVIQFTFDNSNQLSDDSLYLSYLRLTDYGQLKTVYQYNQPIKLTQLVE
ncbi:MAG TPA: DUF4785 family protein [Legionella sp.]|nr:DUF4785 family protein [Legionella sp.]